MVGTGMATQTVAEARDSARKMDESIEKLVNEIPVGQLTGMDFNQLDTIKHYLMRATTRVDFLRNAKDVKNPQMPREKE